MLNQALKKELKKLYTEIPSRSNEGGMQCTIYQARKIMLKIEDCDTDISFWTFFWSQLRFIKKKVWIAQFGILLLFSFYLIKCSGASNTIGPLSALLPLCFLTGTGELSRAFVNHTAEMELSTNFTLPQVMLSRITLLGLTHIFVLSLTSIMTTMYLSVNLIHIFMYFCVPFFITSFGCLYILNHIYTKECNYYCGAWSAVVILVLFSLSQGLPVLYEASLIWCWCLLFVITSFGVLLEFRLLIKNCEKDSINHLILEGGY